MRLFERLFARRGPTTPSAPSRRVLRQIVRDRESLATLAIGGSPERPIKVTSTAVIEPRTLRSLCPQCDGTYHIDDHRAPRSGLRAVDVTCAVCRVSRTLWYRVIPAGN